MAPPNDLGPRDAAAGCCRAVGSDVGELEPGVGVLAGQRRCCRWCAPALRRSRAHRAKPRLRCLAGLRGLGGDNRGPDGCVGGPDRAHMARGGGAVSGDAAAADHLATGAAALGVGLPAIFGICLVQDGIRRQTRTGLTAADVTRAVEGRAQMRRLLGAAGATIGLAVLAAGPSSAPSSLTSFRPNATRPAQSCCTARSSPDS